MDDGQRGKPRETAHKIIVAGGVRGHPSLHPHSSSVSGNFAADYFDHCLFLRRLGHVHIPDARSLEPVDPDRLPDSDGSRVGYLDDAGDGRRVLEPVRDAVRGHLK